MVRRQLESIAPRESHATNTIEEAMVFVEKTSSTVNRSSSSTRFVDVLGVTVNS